MRYIFNLKKIVFEIMSVFTIEVNYQATYTAIVEAEDEGQALDKARTQAEEADIRDFNIHSEMESNIISRD